MFTTAAEGSAPACWSGAVAAELPASKAAEALTCSPSGGVWASSSPLQPPRGPCQPTLGARMALGPQRGQARAQLASDQ